MACSFDWFQVNFIYSYKTKSLGRAIGLSVYGYEVFTRVKRLGNNTISSAIWCK